MCMKELFIRYVVRFANACQIVCVCCSFRLISEGGMLWLTVLFPNHCLSFLLSGIK